MPFENQANHVKTRCNKFVPQDQWQLVDNGESLISAEFKTVEAAFNVIKEIFSKGLELEKNSAAYSVIDANQPNQYLICVDLTKITTLSTSYKNRAHLFTYVPPKFDLKTEVTKLKHTMDAWIGSREAKYDDSNFIIEMRKLGKGDHWPAEVYEKASHTCESLPYCKRAKNYFEKILEDKPLSIEEIDDLNKFKNLDKIKGSTADNSITALLTYLSNAQEKTTNNSPQNPIASNTP